MNKDGPRMLLACGVIGFLACSALAADSVWRWTDATGDHDVMTAGNWTNDQGGTPPASKYDWGKAGNKVLVFNPGAGKSFDVKNTMWTSPWYFLFKEIRVESGTVNFLKSDGVYFAQADSGAVTSAIYVAEGALANWNTWIAADAATTSLRKTGGGEIIFGRKMGHSAAGGTKPLKALVVEEGICRRNDLSATVGSDTWRNNVNNIIVRDGALFSWNSYGLLEPADNYKGPYTALHIDRGGRVQVGESSGTTLDGLSGEGDIEVPVSHTITLALKAGDYVYSGVFKGNRLYIGSEATHTFTVGGARTLNSITQYVEGFQPRGTAVRFAAGIGEFWINRYSGTGGGTLPTEDVAGRPIRLHVNGGTDYVAGGAFTGSGTLILGQALTGDKALVRDSLAISCHLETESGIGLDFGRNAAGTDPDLSSVRSIRAGDALTFNGADRIDVPCVVSSESALMVKGGGARVADLRKTAGDFSIQGPLAVEGGEIVGTRQTWRNSYEKMFARPRRIGSSVSYGSAFGYLSISNAHLVLGWGGGTNQRHAFGSFSAVDSLVEMIRPLTESGYEDAYEILLDGSTLRVSMPLEPYSFPVPYGLDTVAGTTVKPWTIRIGSKGAKLETEQSCCYADASCHTVNFGMSVEKAAGVDRDGGLSLGLANVLNLYRPVNLAGPVTLTNGKVVPCASAFANTASVFGTGDLTLDGAWLANSRDARIASGDGGKLRIAAAARMSFRAAAGDTAATVTAGPEDAAESSLAFGPAGALFLSEPGTLASFPGAKLLVRGGVPTHADGRVKGPVFSAVKESQDHHLFDFVSYGDGGFSGYAGGVTDFDHGADSVVNADVDGGTTLEVPANETRQVAALRASGWRSANWNTIRAAVKVNSGATLKVGDADGNAQVLLNCRGNYGRAEISGAGTLDFGTNRVVVGCGACANTSGGGYPSLIATKIVGSGPITFAGLFGDRHPSVRLTGANDYSGGTYVSEVQVRVESDTALGSGPVRVMGGNAISGQLCFDKENLVFANALTVSGHGIPCVCGSSDSASTENGALWFTRSATVSGPVVIDGEMRVCARAHASVGEGKRSGVGTFTGVVSGGRLQLMKNEQPIVLAGANDYAGGTEIVSSTLILRGPCSAGTGPVELDNGILRFENDAPVTFANDIEGVGTIEIAGTAPVSFTGKGLESLPAALRTLGPGSSVDLPNFTACVIHVAADADLGGASLSLAGFGGSGRISNGVLTVSGDINPAGAGTVGTLTFAAGVLNPVGATFVCDVAPAGADAIVVEESFDLSKLSFRTVFQGGKGYVQRVFSSVGLTGAFAGTQFAKRNHQITVDETDVTLDARPLGGVILIR